jgi:glycosyltransferase involved in cell wall biosynthesis
VSSGNGKRFEVDVVIPARDCEATVGAVVLAMPPRAVRTVVVVDNGSSDATARVAEDAGAVVVREPRAGYGAACLRGVVHLSTLPRPPDVVVFLAADGTDDPADIPSLVGPLRESLFDLVIGSRTLGRDLPTSARAANFVATRLIHAIYGQRYTDLGPFRAIRYPALIALGMRDAGSGWLAEMQVKAAKVGLRVAEVPVRRGKPPEEGGLGARLRNAASAGTKTIFHILRHSTAR